MDANISFSIDAIDYTLTIENSRSEVSPGGELRFKVVGSDHDTNFGIYYLYFDTDNDALVEKTSTNQIVWDYLLNLSHPRYAHLKIKDDVSIDLPANINLNIYSDYQKTNKVATATFKILKDGNKGHNPYKGKYVKDIVAEKNHISGKHSWYKITCMSSPNGICNINLKDGEHNKYNGQKPRISHHSASDRNYPGTSRLEVGKSLVFDARELVVENNNEANPPLGYDVEMNAVCRFSSDNPIMIEPIDDDWIGKKV